MNLKKVKKEAAKLQARRDRACSLFQLLEYADQDHAFDAILAYEELWSETRKTRASMFNFELQDVVFPEWKPDLTKIDGPRSRNMKAKNLILKFAKDGYGNLYPEMNIE